MWRLELDIPYTFQVKPGFERAQHALDFDPQRVDGVYLDRRAGLAMLTPSTLTGEWRNYLVPINDLNRQANFWTRASRASKIAITQAFLAKSNPAGQSPSLIELLINIAILAVTGDMRWVMETVSPLDADESFTFYIQCADDEYARTGDYFYLQWGDYGFYANTTGEARFCRYNDGLTNPPTLLHQWNFTQGGNFLREAAAFTFIPCPPVGYLVIFSVRQPAGLQSSNRSTVRTVVSSEFIPLAQYATNTGSFWQLTTASQLHIGINPRLDPIIALERVRFTPSGELLDKPFAVGYTGTSATHTPLVYYSRIQSASTALRTADGTASWNGQADASMRVNLTTVDSRYTPFVYGYFVKIDPEYALRNTTPVPVKLLSLEYTVNDRGRDEGVCEILADTPELLALIKRGDATYRLAYQDGTQWRTVGEGYAHVAEIEEQSYGYRSRAVRATLDLKGWWVRFSEVFTHDETAFDGVTFPEAIAKFMIAAGYPPIPTTDYPTALQSLTIPTAGEGATSAGWRFSPRVGQSGLEVLRSLLILVNSLTDEYRIRYDYALERFRFESKPRPTVAIRLTPDSRTDTIPYRELKWRPLPPEANILCVEGATRPDSEGARIVKVLVNETSLINPASSDYLGRVKLIRITADSLQSEAEVDRFADLVYPHLCRHHAEGTIKVPVFLPDLLELPQLLQIEDTQNNVILTAYAHTVTLTGKRTPNDVIWRAAEMAIQFHTEFLTDPREL